ncbi:MAG: redoxin domain-containing protein [Bacteroidales bacterium]|nr:redoxin domain-containing protein [Bacteroidales bacterium]
MKKLLYLAVLLSFCACSSDKASIKLKIDGAANRDVVLSILNVNKVDVVDTFKTDAAGKASAKIDLPYQSPNFYYLDYNGIRIASLLLAPGDKAKVEADSNGRSVKVSGSKESELLQSVDQAIAKSQKSFDSLSVQLIACNEIGDVESVKRIRVELGKLYVNQKQAAVKHLVKNPYSFTNLRNLYRQFNENFPLFSELTDGVYFRQLADSLQTVYPNSPYVAALDKEAISLFNEMDLSYRMKDANQINFPEIALPDTNAEIRSLTDLSGKPFLLIFWDPADNNQKMFNAELEKIYNQFKGRGLEIYSVCVGTDKAYWNSIVNRFPWINVCDGKGSATPGLVLYNVTKLPAMFIFNKNGEIVGKDIFDNKGLVTAVSSVCQE